LNTIWNEAQFRGIDTRELIQESFTTFEHLQMIRSHEAKVRIYWQSVKMLHDFERQSKTKKEAQAMSVATAKLKNNKRASFTDVQLKIAISALRGN